MKTTSIVLVVIAAILFPCLVMRGQQPANPDGSRPDLRKKQSVDELITLAKSENRDIRLKVARELGHFSYEAKKAVPVLTKLLDDDFWATRMEAALSFGKLGPDAKAAVPRLARSLTDCDVSVREAAYIALGQMGNSAQSAVPALESQLDNRDSWARELAAAGLGMIGCGAKTAVPMLDALLHDDDSDVRQAARQALSLIDPDDYLANPAIRTLPDERQDQIVSAAIAKREDQSLSEWIEMTKDPNPRVREDGTLALRNMGPAAKAAVPASSSCSVTRRMASGWMRAGFGRDRTRGQSGRARARRKRSMTTRRTFASRLPMPWEQSVRRPIRPSRD